jgi:hypothetical protein
MHLTGILVKALLFCVFSSINDKVRQKPLSAIEAVFVIEIIQEAYGYDEDDKKD